MGYPTRSTARVLAVGGIESAAQEAANLRGRGSRVVPDSEDTMRWGMRLLPAVEGGLVHLSAGSARWWAVLYRACVAHHEQRANSQEA